MIKKVIKVPFVEEVTGKTSASVRFVEQTTIPLDTTVQAAIDGLFVIGQAQLVKNNFLGLMKSMADGVQRDGKPRKIADFLRVFPVFTGTVDLDKGFDPKENGVYLAAALLNEMKLDISGWSFEDVTKGRQPIHLESATGSAIGYIDPSKSVELNGSGLSGDHRVELRLEGGELVKVAPEHVTGKIARMDIAAEAFAPFIGEENYGKKLTITVRGNFANDSITAMIEKPVTPPVPRGIVKVMSQATGHEGTMHLFNDTATVTVSEIGENAEVEIDLIKRSTGEKSATLPWVDGNEFRRVDAKTFELKIVANPSPMPDGLWQDPSEYEVRLVIRDEAGEVYRVITHE